MHRVPFLLLPYVGIGTLDKYTICSQLGHRTIKVLDQPHNSVPSGTSYLV